MSFGGGLLPASSLLNLFLVSIGGGGGTASFRTRRAGKMEWWHWRQVSLRRGPCGGTGFAR
jgi:hypothetical protein